MRKLILIKHSHVAADPDVPAKYWCLSPQGRRRCTILAQRLSGYDLAHIVASTEPKASETAQLLAAELNLPWHKVDGLHEHDRSNELFHSSEQFQRLVTNFFAHPNKLIFGKETANEALTRFGASVGRVIDNHAEPNVAIVTHGTVMSLFVAAHNQINSFELWQRLTMPSFVALALPHFVLVEEVVGVETTQYRLQP